MNWSTGSKEVTISILNSNTSLSVYKSFLLDAGVIFPEGLSVNFKSSSGVQNLSTRGAKTIKSQVVFDGIGGKWQVTDSLVFFLTTILNGELAASGKVIRTGFIKNSGKLSLTNSIIYVTEINTNNSGVNNILSGSTIKAVGYCDFNVDGLPLNIDTLYASGSSLELGNANIYKAQVSSTIIDIKKANTVRYLVSTAEKILVEEPWTVTNFSATGLSTLEITGKLITNNATLTGNGCFDYLTIKGGEWQQNTGTINLNYAQVKNLTCSGGAIFKASNSIDLGINTGINIIPTTSSTYYWVGGSGRWNDPAHWSLVSGGSSSGCIPSSIDDVEVNQLSDNNSTFTISLPWWYEDSASAYCRNLNVTDLDNSCSLGGELFLHGSISLNKNVSATLRLHCNGSQAHTIDVKNYFSSIELDIDCQGAYSLLDSIRLATLTIRKGTFTTNGKKVYTSGLYNKSTVAYQGTLDLSSSEIFVQDELDFQYDSPLNFNPGTSHIYFSGTYIFATSDYNFYNLTLNGPGEKSVSAECTYNKITINSKTYIGSVTTDTLHIQAGSIVTFAENTNTVIQKRFAIIPSPNGCSTLTKLQCWPRTSTASITSASAQISITNTAIENIIASGGAAFFANNSILNGNTNGWTSSTYVPKNLYWVGSSGQWDDPTHWATISGGTASGCDIPSEADNVIIDNHSTSHVTCAIDLGIEDRNILSLNIN